jgi:ketosteroid isomerase-like protein
MKTTFLFILLYLTALSVHGQQSQLTEKQKKEITSLIDNYSLARENRDTVLLKSILTTDIDQLVSTGEWRSGISSSVKGMLGSSAASPGTRTLTVEKIRMLAPNSALVDCKYEIKNYDGSSRRMWSTFIVLYNKGSWKIAAIRNMLPSKT